MGTLISEYFEKNARSKYESAFALMILKQPEFVEPIVSNVSHIISNLLKHEWQTRPELLLTLYDANQPLYENLYNNTAYGRLGYADTLIAPRPFLEKYLKMLAEPLNDLPLTMHLQLLFFQFILPNLSQNTLDSIPNQTALMTRLNHDSEYRKSFKHLFYVYENEKERGRIKKKYPPATLEKEIGYKGIIDSISFPHDTALLSFLPPSKTYMPCYDSGYFKSMGTHRNRLPFMAGCSGHTGIFLRGFLQIIPFEIENFKTYLSAMAAFMISGKVHSWNEIMVQVKQLGIGYEAGDYYGMLPKLITENRLFLQLKRDYAILFQHTVETHCSLHLEKEIEGSFKSCKA